ncbi:hypothetical protein AB0392_12375 [Nonomuraea angiospora]|uniref:hypothetical protein n=1 Tax=Nonomuraea angiospora TaxID=46172 RepID=UPI00344E2139
MRVAARLGRLESPGFIRGERFNFVVVYLALGPAEREEIQWMFYVGLVITVSDVLVAVASR